MHKSHSHPLFPFSVVSVGTYRFRLVPLTNVFPTSRFKRYEKSREAAALTSGMQLPSLVPLAPVPLPAASRLLDAPPAITGPAAVGTEPEDRAGMAQTRERRMSGQDTTAPEGWPDPGTQQQQQPSQPPTAQPPAWTPQPPTAQPPAWTPQPPTASASNRR